MIDKKIVEMILRGERVRIAVNGTDSRAVFAFKGWLRQFREKCNGAQCVSCNTILEGNAERLSVTIGTVPHGQRELLAGVIQNHDSPDSPLKIEIEEAL